VLYVLNDLFENGEIPECRSYVDSPLAVSATEIYRLHPDAFNEEVYQSLFEKQNPFGFENLTLVRSVSGSKALNDIDGVAIIISASGMCEAGRILHHLKNNIGDPKPRCCSSGIARKTRSAAASGMAKRRCRSSAAATRCGRHRDRGFSFSGHADHSELLDYFDRTTGAGGRRIA
jgi:metallo-beta-lactamase family protein